MAWAAVGGGVAMGVTGHLLGGGGDSSANDTQEQYVGYNTQGGLFDPRLIKGVKGESDDTLDFGVGGDIGALQNQLVGGSGNLFGQGQNWWDSLGSSNPFETQQRLYDQLSPQMIDQQNQDFFDMEGRIFGQGRLGSTGGSDQLNALSDSHQDARSRLLFDTFGQGLQAQAHQGNMAGLFGNAGNQQLLAALGIQGGANDSTRLATLLGGASRISEHSGGQPVGQGGFFDSLGTGLMTNGINQVNSGVNGMFQTQPYQSTPAFDNGGNWLDSGGNQAYQQGYMGPR